MLESATKCPRLGDHGRDDDGGGLDGAEEVDAKDVGLARDGRQRRGSRSSPMPAQIHANVEGPAAVVERTELGAVVGRGDVEDDVEVVGVSAGEGRGASGNPGNAPGAFAEEGAREGEPNPIAVPDDQDPRRPLFHGCAPNSVANPRIYGPS